MLINVADYPFARVLTQDVQYKYLLYEYFTIFVWLRDWYKHN